MITSSTYDKLLSGMHGSSETTGEETQDQRNLKGPDGPQPIIGIPLPVQQGRQGPVFLADAVGPWSIERMRGRIFLIPLWPFPVHKQVYQSLWPLIQLMDGLFLPAGLQGTDWYTSWKGSEQEPEPEHWPITWEIALAQLATAIGMPLLAVADGAEKWNSALGGKRGEARRDVAQAVSMTPDAWDRHTVRVRAQSKLASYLQPAIVAQDGEQKPWKLAFLPGQGIESLASGLRSCAQSEEGTIAAFERRDSAFGLGIIGRLDWELDQPYSTTIFDAFLQACQSFDHLRQQYAGWEAARDSICATVNDLVMQGRSLIGLSQMPQREKGPLSRPLPSSNSSTEQGRLRPHSSLPTKQELNRIKRQLLYKRRKEKEEMDAV
jgi:gamma-glutamyl-gamma-aminobutyrate hydrolase PuuD